MNAAKASGWPVLKAIQRFMSTPPNSQEVFMQWCTSASSMSLSKAAPARANRSPSPVASITTSAMMAMRPSLLSKATPLTRAVLDDRACAAQRVVDELDAALDARAPARRSFSRSGSMVGDQVTTPW